jgi:hypothetical protein
MTVLWRTEQKGCSELDATTPVAWLPAPVGTPQANRI